VYCNKCNTYIGNSALVSQLMCINCNENVNIDTSVRNGHYFLTYPLERSLREVLELHGVGKFLCDQVASMPLTDKSVLSDMFWFTLFWFFSGVIVTDM